MPAKPITEYAGGKGPRQCIWEAIRALRASGHDTWTESDLWRRLPGETKTWVSDTAIRDYRVGLVAAGIVAVVTPAAPRKPATYRLVRDEGLDAPRVRRNGTRVTQGYIQEQMWRTLRHAKGDTNARELAAHASTSAIPVAEASAADYLLTLHTAGYLDRTAPARYRLKPSRNTGPRPPMVCRTRIVYDPNEDKIVWQPRITEEEAIYG